jgi:hypothetical protein
MLSLLPSTVNRAGEENFRDPKSLEEIAAK